MDVTTIRLKTLYNPSKSIQAILKDRINWFCKKTPPHLVKVLVVFVNLRVGKNRIVLNKHDDNTLDKASLNVCNHLLKAWAVE